MKITMCWSVFFMFLIGIISAQKKQTAFDKAGSVGEMMLAEQKFFAEDYRGALIIYNNILKGKQNDANVIYHIAECYFEMHQLKEAQENAEKAKGIDPKANVNNFLLLGKLYQLAGKLDEALTEFTTFKTQVDAIKALNSGVDRYIGQINTAKNLMANPIDVKIENMGSTINSEYDEKAPMVSADGKILIFTSRRPGRSSSINPDDNKYYEDIYLSHLDSATKAWTNAELLSGAINTDGHDACTSISPDGKQIFLFKNNIERESRGGDIYVSRLGTSKKWGAPMSVGKPINTTYAELGACLSPDGKFLYFVSERIGGFGNADIWVSKKKTHNGWDTPENLGSIVNTAEDEAGLFLAPDGKSLFFTSNGHNSMGGYDMFKTTLENGKWSTPINLGYPINSIYNDYCFSLSVDARTGYFSSDRPGGMGERDIYKVGLMNYPVLDKEMKFKTNTEAVMAILKGDIFDATKGAGMVAEVVLYDETGTKIGSTLSEISGEYFITLPADKKNYRVTIDTEGFKSIDEKVEIRAAKEGATTVIKHYLLYKK